MTQTIYYNTPEYTQKQQLPIRNCNKLTRIINVTIQSFVFNFLRTIANFVQRVYKIDELLKKKKKKMSNNSPSHRAYQLLSTP